MADRLIVHWMHERNKLYAERARARVSTERRLLTSEIDVLTRFINLRLRVAS